MIGTLGLLMMSYPVSAVVVGTELVLRLPDEEHSPRDQQNARTAKHSCELGQRHERLRADDVHHHEHEVDAGLLTRHPAEIRLEAAVLVGNELAERHEIEQRQREHQPGKNGEVRIDLEHDGLLRAGNLVHLRRQPRIAACVPDPH